MTLEWADRENVILNIINLSDEVLVVRADYVILVGPEGQSRYGQVIAEKLEKATRTTYKGSAILKPKGFNGYTIAGPFDLEGELEKVAVRLGSRIFFFEGLDSERFEIVAKQIPEIDLETDNAERAVLRAGISRKFGSVQFRGDPDAPETVVLFPDREILPPVILRRVEPELTSAALQAGARGQIVVEGLVARGGGFLNGKVVKGIGHGMDERTLETIKNGWKFLPAVQNGEVVETTVTVRVEIK